MGYEPALVFPEARQAHAIAIRRTHRPGRRRLLRRRCSACHRKWPCDAAEWAESQIHCHWFHP